MDRAILLTGTVGAGKSTTAEAISSILWNDGVLHAVIDLDAVRLLRPPPVEDPFSWRLLLENVGALSANYARAGAEVLLLAGVVETAADLASVQERISAPITPIRLVAEPAETERRLRARHEGDDAAGAWHLKRFPALDAVLDAWTALPRIETTGRTPHHVADQVLVVSAEPR